MQRLALPILPFLLVACEAFQPAAKPFEQDGFVEVQARFDLDGAFWDAPFPSDHRVREDTRKVDLTGFPGDDVPVVGKLLALLDGQVQGWARSGAIRVPFDAPLSTEHLPGLLDSVDDPAATVFLVDVDRDGEPGTRYPVEVAVETRGGVFRPVDAIVALPFQGRPLPDNRRMALVVRRAVRDAEGLELRTSGLVDRLADGTAPSDWRDDVAAQYIDAVAVLKEAEIDLTEVAGITVFSTGTPTRSWPEMVRAVEEDGGMRLVRSARLVSVEDGYCLYEGTFETSVYQRGEPPYLSEGGGIVLDRGDPVEQRRERGRYFLTVPTPEPASGERPLVVFIRTGGGGDNPLVDRSVRTEAGVDGPPRQGLAALFARHGWAALQLDGPLGGDRNLTEADEQFTIFNVQNPEAIVGNLMQSAFELIQVPSILPRLTMSAGTCPGLGANPAAPIVFQDDDLVLFGHSMGASIAPLVLAGSDRYAGAMLSGLGGSWMQNVVHKQSPVATAPLAAALLQETVEDVDGFHPALTLLQWAGEPVDPPLVGEALVHAASGAAATHVLMMQGVVDTYIPPPVANAVSVAWGLDLAGTPRDGATGFSSLQDLLPLSRGVARTLPAAGNIEVGKRRITGVVVQLDEDGVEDGHEVAFQTDEAKHLMTCFLHGMADDIPVVPDPVSEATVCPQLAPAGD